MLFYSLTLEANGVGLLVVMPFDFALSFLDMEAAISIKRDIVEECCPRSVMLNFFREGFLALQRHFDTFKAGAI